jgi:PAS domain S-box-containing protein
MDNFYIKKYFLKPILILIFISIATISTINIYFTISTIDNFEKKHQLSLIKQETPQKNLEELLQIQTKSSIFYLIVITLFITLITIGIGIYISIKIHDRIKTYTKDIIKDQKDLEIAQDVANMGSWFLDVNKDELVWSKQSYKIFEADYSKKNLTSASFMDFIHPDDKVNVERNIQKSIDENRPFHMIHRLVMKDGREKVVEAKGEVFFLIDENNSQKTIFNGTVQDITEQYNKEQELKETEKQLTEQEKLASMGNLIGNIAHQWRQPLSVISACASGLALKNEIDKLEKKEIEGYSKEILANVENLSNTIETFRDSNISDSISEFNIKDMIKETLSLKSTIFEKNNITIKTDIPSNITTTNFANNLKESLSNILTNSIEAFKDREDEEKYIFIEVKKNIQNKITIKIKDSAGGVSQEDIDKLFDPYFTTKEIVQGKGLGLHITYRLITQGMQGKIYAKNSNYTYEEKQYKGLMFIITI